MTKRLSASGRRLLILAAAVLAPLAILAARSAMTPETTDFRCFWAASAMLLDGRSPYDATEWARATAGVSADTFGRIRDANCAGLYAYPLTTAIVLLPLGALPLGAAAIVWELAIVVTSIVGAALLARAAALSFSLGLVLAILVLASTPFEQTVMSAQFGGLSLLATGLLATARLGPARAGTGLVLAALKPHAIPLVPLVALARMRDGGRGTLALGVAPLVALTLISIALLPAWPVSWLGELGGHRREMFSASVSLWTLGSATGLAAAPVVLIGVALVPLGLALLRAASRQPLDLIAAAALASVVVMPYGLTADQLPALAVTSAAVLARAAAPTISAPLVIGVVAVAGVLPWVIYLLRFDVIAYYGLDLGAALVPVGLALLLAAAVERERVHLGYRYVASG